MTTYKGNHGTYGRFGKTIPLSRLHTEQIRCKRCKSIDCHGCNLFRLEQMLKEGKLDEMMGKDHGIKTDLSVRPVVHGEWIYHDDDDMRYDTYHCSVCRKLFTVDAKRVDDIGFVKDDLNYCPNCGADMRPSEEPESLTYIPPEERSGVDDG